MGFKCGSCGEKETLDGAIYETCANCGWSTVDRLVQVKQLIARIEMLENALEPFSEAWYDPDKTHASEEDYRRAGYVVYDF